MKIQPKKTHQFVSLPLTGTKKFLWKVAMIFPWIICYAPPQRSSCHSCTRMRVIVFLKSPFRPPHQAVSSAEARLGARPNKQTASGHLQECIPSHSQTPPSPCTPNPDKYTPLPRQPGYLAPGHPQGVMENLDSPFFFIPGGILYYWLSSQMY